ncbi:MAG: helix-turn-helix transcriptional regulator [Oscillospiraceae bacterium]|nr:helix-turn-helix transcriptional regulator [Oscillospiraceae bacterium]
MTDKKTLGSFIKAKRTGKHYSQKDLAELLFVTEGAVSKWERGVSYPDITLIADICRVLEISEHEFITASTDTETRKIKHEARKFRRIRSTWVWVPTICYGVALLTCLICNLAVNHTLSWFFIVLAALICAYTFVPTVTCFVASGKLLAFAVSSYLSIGLLLFTCAVYTGGLSWFLTACIGVLMGYELVFMPIFLAKSRLSRWKFVISFGAAWVLTMLLLLNVRIWHPFMLLPSIGITCYAFAPAILCTVLCVLRLDGFLKAGVCIASSTVMLYFTNHVVSLLLGYYVNHYEVDFSDWEQCLNGNVHFIVLIVGLLISAVFTVIGLIRTGKKRR